LDPLIKSWLLQWRFNMQQILRALMKKSIFLHESPKPRAWRSTKSVRRTHHFLQLAFELIRKEAKAYQCAAPI
jgi:hypothetical protein